MKSTKNCEELGIITFEKAKEVFTTKSFVSRHLARLLAIKEAFCGIIGWVMLAMVAIESTSDEPIFSFEVNMK